MLSPTMIQDGSRKFCDDCREFCGDWLDLNGCGCSAAFMGLLNCEAKDALLHWCCDGNERYAELAIHSRDSSRRSSVMNFSTASMALRSRSPKNI